MRFIVTLALAAAATASISYSKYVRSLQGSAGNTQAYFVVDEAVWVNARPDLGDLRLDPGEHEVPYALRVERGSSESQEVSVPVLQAGTVGGDTQFFLDMSRLAQYDHIELQLKNPESNLVAHLEVDGQDDLHGHRWSKLAQGVVYDLGSDGLGSNTQVRLPLSSYKYLRIIAEAALQPSFIAGASAYIRQEEKAVWRTLPASGVRQEQNRDTVFTFTPPKNAPVDRVEFLVDGAQPNFRRPVEVRGGKEETLGAGEISRVHLVRAGQKIDFEQTAIGLNSRATDSLRVIIHNGDDRPLALQGAQLQQYERRVYFNSPTAGLPHLYYGDGRLEPPTYDFEKVFVKDPHAVPVSLGPEQPNPAYRGRPDDRPWSERHPAILWLAIVLAVIVLGAIALRSMKTTAAAG